jgi:uncharacterized protein DUF3631
MSDATDYVNDLAGKAFKNLPDDPDTLTIVRLAALSPIEYDRCRKAEAQKLKIRENTLDNLVNAERSESESENATDELAQDVDPWLNPVVGNDVLNEARALLNKYCVLPQGADIAIVLWIAAGYSINCFRIFPKLCLSSPEKRCGKTTTLEVINALSYRALMASNLSAAVLFRSIDAWQPTLLIDEADTFLHGNDELRGVINSGHTRAGAFVLRVDGDALEPKKFSTWAPTAVAMIKTPPDTILDRSVMIRLKRKAPGDKVEKLPYNLFDQCIDLRRKIKRFTDDGTEALKNADPEAPKLGSDRAQDNWLPLLAVADVVGGDWPALAREAMEQLEQKEDADEGAGVMLLSDVQSIFTRRKTEKLSSEDIVSELVGIDERPWAEWRRGNPLSKNALARLLKPFDIKPKTIRTGGVTFKGYLLGSFQDAFARYLPNPADPTVTPSQVNNDAASRENQTVTPETDVTVEKPRKAIQGADSYGVTVEIPLKGQSGETLL